MRLIGNALRRLRPWLKPRRFEVVIVGRPYGRWREHLREGGAAWQGSRRVRSVRLVRDGAPSPGGPTGRRQFAIVFQVGNILRAPDGCWTLLPDEKAVRVLNDKRRFADYVAAEGLSALAPQTYATPAEARFPCVAKRTDLASGVGVRVARDAGELALLLGDKPFVGEPHVLQAFVPGPEFTVHGIVTGGRFAWAACYGYAWSGGLAIREPREDEPTRAVPLSAADRATLERFLVPLRYDGPVNIDFKRGADGGILVLEINPRFGSSLFWTQNLADLRMALDTLLAHARWHPPRRKR